MYDCIIIGAGPAGMTAGIYTARKQLQTLILAKQVGGQMVWSSDIENYTGFSLITGADLTENFKKHLDTLKDNLELQEGVEVVSITRLITGFEVVDSLGKKYQSRSVIVASGKEPRHLGIPGEQEFYGKGVSVCATCDAPLYKNKDVAVIGGGNSAMDALQALSKIAKRVYSVNINEKLAGDDLLKKRVESLPNITFYPKAKTLEILGGKFVESLKIQDQNHREVILPVSGVFAEIGFAPSVHFAEIVNTNDHQEVMVDGNLQTSVPGIFAAGDCNDAWGEQIIIAAGEGAKAAMAAADFLNSRI